jgi:hydroxymethylglutaryl-CoA synthase
MTKTTVGISDLEIFVPNPVMDLETLVKLRSKQNPQLERRLFRALDTTGQKAMRYPELWQDSATLSSHAAHRILSRADRSVLPGLRYLAVGTETSVDHSKPISAYVEGMLQHAGIEVPESISTFQVQHACAGGTISMLSVGALLQASSRTGESGIVICSDVARYDAPSTAEITQGAGAVAMLIQSNPALIELDISTQGYASRDVDDFFRPLGSVTARVKGGYSVQCYHDAFEAAFLDHCQRIGEQPGDALLATDMFVVHVPFYRMAITALQRLVTKHTSITSEDFPDFMEERGFLQGIEPATRIGNIYSGATYMSLMFLLADRYRTFADDIVGKRLLIGSYGSGNTMTVIGGRVAAGAPEVIRGWDLDSIWRAEERHDFSHYEQWMEAPYTGQRYRELMADAIVPDNSYYLSDIRDDGYREYRFKP